ncbi:MAG TPA: hypothetical protein VN767_16770 [Streptosporangiaceae bacterium]|jgi:hypothetical protein|nr:hypothetical protein [Streptosporangiaceae bacterium]
MKLATAATATARPTLPLTGLAAELREAQQRLDVLDAGDPAANVEVSIPATASLDGLAPAHAESTLRLLARTHLLTEHVPGRYSLHDLLRAYAAEQARAADSRQHPDRGQCHLLLAHDDLEGCE